MKSLMSYLFIPILTYVIGSCNISITNKCKVENAQTEATVHIGNYPIETQIWKPVDSGSKHYQFISGNSEEKLDGVLSYVSPGIYQEIKGKSIANLVYYLDGYMTGATKFSREDVLGVGVYYHNNDKLYYSFYKKQGDRFILLPKFTSAKSFVSTNDIFAVMRANFDTTQPIGAYSIRDNKELFHHNE